MVYREMNHYDEAMQYIQKERRVIDEHFEEDALRLSANLYEEGYIGMLMGNDVEDTKRIMLCALKYAKYPKTKLLLLAHIEVYESSMEEQINTKKRMSL